MSCLQPAYATETALTGLRMVELLLVITLPLSWRDPDDPDWP